MPHELHVVAPDRAEVLRFSETVRVGRAESNGLVVNHAVVSAEHLELRRSGNEWEVVDLDSTNGTLIDGKRVTRAPVGPQTTVRLGLGGPDLHLTLPEAQPAEQAVRRGTPKGETKEVVRKDLIDRIFGAHDPENMSSDTQMMRAAAQEIRDLDAFTWLRRIRRHRLAIGILALVAVVAGGSALWQMRRVRALRTTAGAVFNTMKALDLDMRRLAAAAGPDSTLDERRARLESQYDDLLKTLGIYSDQTPADVQLIYRTVHRLGESEAMIPRGFVDEVRRYIKRWNAEDLEASLARATRQQLGPQVAAILRQHHLPREFFYIALQESKLDPRAIGPSTRLGVPKGLWQLIPPTAEAYGLRLGALQGERAYDPADERHDVTKATNAAARYLADIYTTDAQASGLLVMASYNMGETRLRALIRSLPESPAERNFWAQMATHRRDIPQETYDYVFRVVAAAVIGENPTLFGFGFAPPLGEVPSPQVGGISN